MIKPTEDSSLHCIMTAKKLADVIKKAREALGAEGGPQRWSAP